MSRFDTGVVIVGGSAAGLSAADGLREGGYEGSIIVLDDHLEPGFDRPVLSKGLLAAGDDKQPAPLRTRERLDEQRITVLSGHRAMGLDIERKLVVTSYGEAIPWDQVIIASGVDARRLRTTAGNTLPALRGLADLEGLRAVLPRIDSLTIIGGGFIGLEVAAALRSRELGATVLCPNALPLVRTLGPRVAEWLRDLHGDRGVDLRLGHKVTAVDEIAGGYRVHTCDGTSFDTGAILAGVGDEPNTDWLLGSGIEIEDGVLVDAAGRTDVPGVWAAGDIAAHRDSDTDEHRRFSHWTHAIEQGRVVGLNIARGLADPYTAVPYVWTEQFGLTLHMLGDRHPDDFDTVVEGSLDSGEFVVEHRGADGELHAATICGLVRAIRGYKKLLRINRKAHS